MSEEIIRADQQMVDAINLLLKRMNEIGIASDLAMFGCPAQANSPDVYIVAGERDKALFRKLYDVISMDPDEFAKEVVRHGKN